MSSKVFISYSRKDSDFALKLGKDLKEKGVNVWLDQLDIKTGQIWDDEVEKALNSRNQFLIILSPESVSSKNVMDELSYAFEENKQIIPVLINDCKRPFRLRRYQFSDFTKDYEKGLNDLLRAFDIKVEDEIIKESKATAFVYNEAEIEIPRKPTKTVPKVDKKTDIPKQKTQAKPEEKKIILIKRFHRLKRRFLVITTILSFISGIWSTLIYFAIYTEIIIGDLLWRGLIKGFIPSFILLSLLSAIILLVLAIRWDIRKEIFNKSYRKQ